MGITAINCLAIASAVSILSCAHAERRIMAFDDGGAERTTVIGEFRDNGLSYHQRVDFTLSHIPALSDVRVQVHAHVGSKIQAAPGQTARRIGIRVNSGEWRWRSLDAYMDDADHWIEFRVPAADLRQGLNSVVTDSTVWNVGNMTPTSLDILGSASGVPSHRSWHTHDLASYVPLPDRNWGIRLSFDENREADREARAIRLVPAAASCDLGKSVQFHLEATDADGRAVEPWTATWSATHGEVDEFGLYAPSTVGDGEVTVRVGALEAKAKCTSQLAVPIGVEPPTSGKRLRPSVPAGRIDLNGKWDFRMDPGDRGEKELWFDGATGGEWNPIHVPGSWQAQGYGMEYHGVAWYRRQLTVPEGYAGREVWLNFDGVATSAKVWVNGKPAGEHAGNWSPFTLRVTDLVHPGKGNSVVVRVQEIPGHFSAGFAQIVGMSFGGIWQSVSAYSSGKLHLDDLFVSPSLKGSSARVEATVSGAQAGTIQCRVVSPDGRQVAELTANVPASGTGEPRAVTLNFPISDSQPWTPEHPALYKVEAEVSVDGQPSDARSLRFGMRDVSTNGSQLLLNGEPIFVRGVLHWGNYPELITIDPSEERIRREFREIRRAGFNLVKVCMFNFPERFYEIADETGMLIWQEYPLWLTFPKSDDKNPHPEILKGYEEWFRFDRNHPSVVLRDLTCEAVDMNPELTHTVFDLGKEMTDGGVIADNSAYMNQVLTDFYDAHMYRELDTQYSDIPGWLIPTIESKGAPKPYLTGEDIDADTYLDTSALKAAFVRDGRIPWWLDTPGFRLQEAMEQSLISRYGADMPARLVELQKRHAIALRRGLMEEYRRHPQIAGYVMTQISDNPLTNPGFLDGLGKPKWAASTWREFSGDRVLILHSPRRSFCFESDETAEFAVELSNYGEAISGTTVKWSLTNGRKVLARGETPVTAARGSVGRIAECRIDLRPFAGEHPRTLKFTAAIDGVAKASWNVWIFPPLAPVTSATVCSMVSDESLKDAMSQLGAREEFPDGATEGVVVTDTLDETVREALLEGARVLYIARGNDSFLPRSDAPFWRELVIPVPNDAPALGDFPHEGFVDRQFLDLTQRKPFALTAIRSEVTPILWGLNARFSTSQYMDYIFEARVGKGSLLACCLRLDGEGNAAGRGLLRNLVQYAAGPLFHPTGESPSLERMLGDQR